MSNSSLIATTPFAVRAATDAERRRLADILFTGVVASTADIMVAAIADERPLGSAAVWYAPSRQFPEYANIGMFVHEPYRRKGVGRALLESAIEAARKVGAGKLRTAPLDHDATGFQFAVACGFRPEPATVTYEAPMKDYDKAFEPVYERLLKRGKIPPASRVVPLSEANKEEVCRLVLDNLGFSSQRVAERLRGTEQGFSQTISRVAILNEKIVGATLVSYHKALASVDGTAVVTQHRNSWVNAALKYHVVKELIARGVQHMRFSANSSEHRDTANIARKINARVLRRVSTVVLDLTPES